MHWRTTETAQKPAELEIIGIFLGERLVATYRHVHKMREYRNTSEEDAVEYQIALFEARTVSDIMCAFKIGQYMRVNHVVEGWRARAEANRDRCTTHRLYAPAHKYQKEERNCREALFCLKKLL